MIYVDADACPVKTEVEDVATRHRVQVMMVSNGGLRPSQNPFVQMVFVESGLDVADDWIAERAAEGDVVVTGDIPLAARVIDAGAQVIKPNGETLNDRNIGGVLATRNLMTDIRSANPFAQGSGRAFSKADRSRFRESLDRLLRSTSYQQGAGQI